MSKNPLESTNNGLNEPLLSNDLYADTSKRKIFQPPAKGFKNLTGARAPINGDTGGYASPDPFSSPFIVPPPKTGHAVSNFASPHHGEVTWRQDLPEKQEGSGLCAVFGNFINAIVGAGIIGLPYVFKQSGIIPGSILMVLMAMLSDYSLRLMVKCAKFVKVDTYEDLCEYCFGDVGFYAVSLAMFLFDFGAMLTYLIILGDSGESLAEAWFDKSGPHVRQIIIVGVACVFILPCCLLRNVSQLEKFSAVSVLTVCVINLIVIYKYFDLGDEHYDRPVKLFNNQFASALGTLAFAFVCQDCAFLMYNTLRNPTTKRWATLTHSALGGSLIICFGFTLFGYLTFRGDVSSNILNDYDQQDKIVQFALVIYVVTMALTYPISFYVTRHVVYALIFRGPQYTTISDAPYSTHLMITLPLFAITVAICMFVTKLGFVMQITGSVAATVLAFVLPAACYLKIQPAPMQFWQYKKGVWAGFQMVVLPGALCVFGLGAMIVSSLQTLAIQFHWNIMSANEDLSN